MCYPLVIMNHSTNIFYPQRLSVELKFTHYSYYSTAINML